MQKPVKNSGAKPSKKASGDKAAFKLVCENRRVRHVLTIDDTFEAGIELTGTEVKSMRDGRAHLSEAYVHVIRKQAYLVGCHIAEYFFGHQYNHALTRSRRLLLHRREIDKIEGALTKDGATALPVKLYFNERGIAKLSFAVGRGKGQRDKREDLRKHEADREMARALRRGQR